MQPCNQHDCSFLIVDDDACISDSLKELIQALGPYAVATAASPQEGLRLIRQQPFDIIFSDILMPNTNGIEFLKQIKRQDPTLSVVMVTGYPTVDVAISAMKEGASDFLVKPFRFNQIKIIIEKLLRERKLLVENARLQSALKQQKTIEQLNSALHSKVKEISILYSISETFSGAQSEPEFDVGVYDRLVNMALDIAHGTFAVLLLYDHERNLLLPRCSCGLAGYKLNGSVAMHTSLISKAVKSGAPVVENTSTAECVDAIICDSGGSLYGSIALLPLLIKNEVFAVLITARNKQDGVFVSDDMILLQNLVEKCSLFIENKLLYESIYENLKDTQHALIAAIEARDRYTLRHSQNVTAYALQTAEVLGLPQEEIDILRSASYLHDIGKIGISDAILLKKGRLLAHEYALIKQHPAIGEKILKPLSHIPFERTVIRHHHERWDGNGYPDGLRGEEIPLLSRIITVADSYDAITTERPYHYGISHTEALNELKRCTDQFDQNVVDALIAALRSMQQSESIFQHLPL